MFWACLVVCRNHFWFPYDLCRGLGRPHHQETTRTHVLLFIHVGDQKWTDKYKRPLVNLGALQDSLII